MEPEHVERVISAEAAPGVAAQQVVLLGWGAAGNAIKIPLNGISRQALKGGLGAENSRRPSQLRIELAKRPKDRPSQRGRAVGPKPVLPNIEFVPSITREALISAVTRKRHRYMLARHLRNVIGRHRGRIGKWFVIMPGQLRQEIDSVWLDGTLKEVRSHTAVKPARVCRLVVTFDLVAA